jgi:hypothetical protein
VLFLISSSDTKLWCHTAKEEKETNPKEKEKQIN